jgi:hypothetical protein
MSEAGATTLPFYIHSEYICKPDKGMAHQGNTTTLRGRAEKGYLHSPFLQVISKLLDCRPGCRSHCLFIVREPRQSDMERSVNFNNASAADLWDRGMVGPKESTAGKKEQVLIFQKLKEANTCLIHFLAIDSACSSSDLNGNCSSYEPQLTFSSSL